MKSDTIKIAFIIILTLIGIACCFGAAIYLLNDYDNSLNDAGSNNSVIRVIDGDTFVLSDSDGGNEETIRLLCADTPEEGDDGYEEAKSYLSSVLFAKEIEIERAERLDLYNRTLAWISYEDDFGNEVLVNKEIIDLGFGGVFEYNNTDCSLVE
jgi:endonuclease YncB( thermonuclease family)